MILNILVLFCCLGPPVFSLILSLTTKDGNLHTANVVNHITLLDQNIQNLQSQIQSVLQSTSSQIALMGTRLHETDSELSQMRAELTATQNELKELKHNYNSTVTDLRAATAELKLSKQDLLNVKAQLQKDENVTSADLKSVKAQLTKTVSALNSTVSGEIIEIKQKVQRSQVDGQNIKKALTLTGKEVDALKYNYNSTVTDLRVATAELKLTKQDLLNVKAQLKNDENVTSADLKSVKAQLTKTVSALNSTLSGKIVDVKQAVQRLQVDGQNMRKTIQSLGNEVSFEAQMTAKHVYVSNRMVLKFDDVKHNIGNGYNSTSGRFTAPVAGTYLTWSLVDKTAGSYLELRIMKPGVEIADGVMFAQGLHVTATVMSSVQMKIGDQMWVDVWGATQIYGHSRAHFGAVLLR